MRDGILLSVIPASFIAVVGRKNDAQGTAGCVEWLVTIASFFCDMSFVRCESGGSRTVAGERLEGDTWGMYRVRE